MLPTRLTLTKAFRSNDAVKKRESRASGSPSTTHKTGGIAVNATQYVAALKRGLKEAVGVIEALDSMAPQSREFETEVLQPCAVC